MWALHWCLNGISNNSNQDTSNLFQTMFPDSKIAKSFQMGPNKIGYSITHGLGPYSKGLLMVQLNQSSWFIVSFKWTYLFDIGMRKGWSRYSSFLWHCTNYGLKNHFNERISDLNLNKILQVSMDCPSVNLKFHKDVQSNHKELELPKRIDIGSCPLHTIHGAFKTGVESTDWEIKKPFKGCFTLLHDSPARRSDYTSIAGSTVFLLSFCATRWVEGKKVVERLISVCPSIVKTVNLWESDSCKCCSKRSFPGEIKILQLHG